MRAGPATLNVDLIDYPGEWIVDLGLLGLDYAAWSDRALAQAQAASRAAAAQPFLAFLASIDPATAEPEPVAIAGAKIFTEYLRAARAAEPALSVLTPGRFLIPGNLAGSPLLTFVPLPPHTDVKAGRSSLHGLMSRRFESYKAQVVKPLFRDHFARLDRQIVLMDTLAAINQGPAGLADLSDAMALVLQAFRTGSNTLGSAIFRPRIDRLVFAATKADHLNRSSHERLEALMRTLAERAILKAEAAGADVRVLALAAVRATRETEVEHDGETLPCIVGTPMPGERVGQDVFDGKTEMAFFPGDLPADPAKLLAAARNGGDPMAHDVRALTFRPPRLTLQTGGGAEPPLPHIRLDRALEFLLGDHLT
jgi:predicted YcjX-like family ATPase